MENVCKLFWQWDSQSLRGGEWSLKKYGSCKILVKFHGSRFWAVLYISQSRCLCKAVLESRSWSRNLKTQKVLVSQRKTLVSPSRKVSNLPFATPNLLWSLGFWNSSLCTCYELYPIWEALKSTNSLHVFKVLFLVFRGFPYTLHNHACVVWNANVLHGTGCGPVLQFGTDRDMGSYLSIISR